MEFSLGVISLHVTGSPEHEIIALFNVLTDALI